MNDQEVFKKPRKKRLGGLSKFKIFLFIATILIAIVVIWSLKTSTSAAFNFVFSSSKLKSTDGRVNVLLLGLAGGRHDGALLTDSIIVASYHIKSKQVTLISVPRDLWLGNMKGKANSAYEIGLVKDEGLRFAEDKIDDVLGLPIHYGIKIDFSGFVKAIDLVDGIDVDVPKTFDDYNYPIQGKEDDLCGLIEKEIDLNPDQAKALNVTPGKKRVLVDTQDKVATEAASFACRFEHIHFDQGKTKMNGSIALTFVRSRMGTNGEGSDFARSRRQQAVIQAFREKILSLDTLSNPKKVADLIKTFGDSIETDIPFESYLEFYDLVKKMERSNSLVLGQIRGKSLLINPPPSEYGGGWVLIPPNNDFTSIQQYIKSELEKEVLQAENKNPTPTPIRSGPTP